jgi:hypothetical protein
MGLPSMKRSTLACKTFCIAALLCAAAWSANANNIVADPGFEDSADGPGPHAFSAAWTNNDSSGFSGVGGDGAFAHSGNNYAFLGANPNTGSLSQSLATVAGTSYTLGFWLANDTSTGPGLTPGNSFQVFWNGGLVFSLTNSAAFSYTQFMALNLVATGAATTLEFRYQHGNDFWRLDDISVSVPEAFSTIWLALPAFGALGLLHFSRARARKSLARI